MRLLIACVRTGEAYPIEHVEKLRNMVRRHLDIDYEIVCLTDQPDRCEGVIFIDVSVMGLSGWWAKMALFEPSWRQGAKVVYFDLDTVIIASILPIVAVPGEFAILESPVRLTGKEYPCRYNSSVMVLGAPMEFVWKRFEDSKPGLMRKHDRFGDQACIEELYPDALLLNKRFPGCFLNYRYLTGHKPKGTAVINFGGIMKPAACDIPWVKEAWQ